MKKWRLNEMCWKEVKEAVEQRKVVLIPMGTTECQNYHNLLGYDYFIADTLANRVAERTDSVVVPTLPFGYSETFWKYPGTIALRPETLSMIVEDVLRSLIHTGFDHFLFIDNHQPNNAHTEAAARKIKREFGLNFASIWPTALARHFSKDQFDKPEEVLIHGAEPGTSMMLYLMGDKVRMDLARNTGLPGTWEGFQLLSGTKINFQGQGIDVYLNQEEVSPGGGFGDPCQGSAEKGKVIFERMVDYVSAFVVEFRKTNTREIRRQFE